MSKKNGRWQHEEIERTGVEDGYKTTCQAPLRTLTSNSRRIEYIATTWVNWRRLTCVALTGGFVLQLEHLKLNRNADGDRQFTEGVVCFSFSRPPVLWRAPVTEEGSSRTHD